MTTRSAELLMAIVMGLFSIGLMWKSTELEIGWIPDRGPGGGAWPFWLSAAMLVCCVDNDSAVVAKTDARIQVR